MVKLYSAVFTLTLSVLLILDAIIIIGLNDKKANADAMLIMGSGGINHDGSASTQLLGRLYKAIELNKQYSFKLIIVSGCANINGYDETIVMSKYLINNGISNNRIYRDNGGYNTFQSAQNARIILKEHSICSILVVTQYFHIVRTILALNRFGVYQVYYAHSDEFRVAHWFLLSRELGALLIYNIRLPYIKPL